MTCRLQVEGTLSSFGKHFGRDILLDTGDLIVTLALSSQAKKITWSTKCKERSFAKALAREQDRLAATEDLFLHGCPLIIKAGYGLVQTVWLVYVTEETQLQRFVGRNALTGSGARSFGSPRCL